MAAISKVCCAKFVEPNDVHIYHVSDTTSVYITFIRDKCIIAHLPVWLYFKKRFFCSKMSDDLKNSL